MNDKIAEILKNSISGLNIVDKITGLVQVGYMTQSEFTKKAGKDFSYNELEVIKFPISQGLIGCENKPYSYDDYLPTKNKKSVIFFEDNGCQVVEQNRKQTDYQSSLKLVCWFNKKMIDPDISRNDIIQNLLLLLVDEKPNTSDINRIYVEFKSQDIHSEDVFGKYDLDKAQEQIMMWPYDCFALNFDILFTINQSCVNEIELKPSTC